MREIRKNVTIHIVRSGVFSIEKNGTPFGLSAQIYMYRDY